MDSNNIVNWCHLREYCDNRCLKIQRKMQINDSLIRRLGLEVELEVSLKTIKEVIPEI